MPDRTMNRPSPAPLRALPLALALALAACAANDDAPRAEVATLTPDQFANPEADLPADTEPTPRTAVTVQAAPRTDDVVVIAGAPAAITPRATTTATPTVAPAAEQTFSVDRMVGQINGRPIYAAEFFRPMESRLRAEAARMGRQEWLAMVRQDIWTALRGRLRDELLLAEFEANITPEQRVGVLAFIESIREQIVSRNFGAESIADSRLRATEGVSLEEKVEDQAKLEFIRAQLRQAIQSRLNVSYRDIRNYYERNYDLFNPMPTATYRVIRVPADDPVRVAVIAEAIASGAPVDEVARQQSSWRPEEAGLREITLPRDASLDDAELFAVPELNQPALALEPGQTTERIRFGSHYWWIHLESINVPEPTPLYEVQLEIEELLLNQRQQDETARYFETLIRRGSFSDIQEMANRLFEYAADRYLIQPGTARALSQAADAAPDTTRDQPDPEDAPPPSK